MAQIEFQPNIKLNIQDIVNLVSQLDTADFDDFKKRIDQVWLMKKAGNLSKKEYELIKQLESTFTPKERLRQAELTEKADKELIDKKENKESLALFEKGQTDYLRRLLIIKEIAAHRGEDFKKTAQEFGILNPANV